MELYGGVLGSTEALYEEAPQAVKDRLAGSWIRSHSILTIDDTTFQSGTKAGGYGGTIEKIRVKRGSLDEGYITIQFTFNNQAEKSLGRYYLFHFQNLTDSGMELSGAYREGDLDFGESGHGGGKETLEAAEDAYTLSAGAFAMHNPIARLETIDLEDPVPAGLINAWEGESDGLGYYTMGITDRIVTLKHTMPDMGPYVSNNFTAAIVNVRKLTSNSGYLTLHYNQSQTSLNQGKYGVLYYQDLEAGASVNMVISANSSSGWGNASKDTALEAERLYVFTFDANIDGGAYLVNNAGNKNAALVAFTPKE